MATSKRSINPLKKRLKAGKAAAGLIVSMPGAPMTQTLVDSGFDWLFMDMEHGMLGIESVHAMIAVTAGSNTAPIVRVPWNVHWLVKPVLDAGAMGVVIPMIRSAEDAEAAVRSVRYPPKGERGFGPFYAPMRFGTSFTEYADAADREVLCILLIEHKDAVADIDRIVAVPGVDACLIAPFDRSMSHGHRDGPDHPEVQADIRRAEKAILASKAHLGGLAFDNNSAKRMAKRGYQLILTGFDTLLVQRSAAAILEDFPRE